MSRARSRKHPRPSTRRQPRGVALLLVLIGIAVLALVAQEARGNSIVELRLATNARDEMRAHFLAKSAIGMSRLVLKFQKQMDNIQIPNLGGLASLLSGAGGAAGLAGALKDPSALGGLLKGAGGGQPMSMSIQLWRMAKVDCYMLQGLVAPLDEKSAKTGVGPKSSDKKFDFDTENPELGAAMQQRSFGGFKGCFDAKISDEEEKINLNKLDSPQLTAQVLLQQTLTTFADKKYDFLWDKSDSHGNKVTASETVLAMRDWVDEDEVGSQINLSGQGEPFQKGFSDENMNYSKYDPRYRAKNARFDSLDELYMIHGVGDRFMAAFKDKLTVYPDINSRLNINTDDPVLLELAIRSVADPSKPDARLQDPVFIDTLIQKIRAARMFTIFGMSTTDFVNVVQAAGVTPNPAITNNVTNQRLVGDKSSTYQIKATGEAGDVTRTITTVVRLDDGLGRLVYWRED